MEIELSVKDIARELGRHGGNSTKEKYGIEHFKRISLLGVEAKKKIAQANKEQQI